MKRSSWKVVGLIVASLVVVSVAAAQVKSAASQVFHLQLQRFEGAYKLDLGGTLSVQAEGEGAVWNFTSTIDGKPVTVQATTRFDPETSHQKAKFVYGAKNFEGTANIAGKELVIEGKSGNEVLRLRLKLSGRTEGEVSVSRQSEGGSEVTVLVTPVKRMP